MDSNHSNTDNMDKELSRHHHFCDECRSLIMHENNIMNFRMTWSLALQALLLGAYINVYDPCHASSYVLIGLCVMGIIFSISTFISLRKNEDAIYHITSSWDDYRKKYNLDTDEYPLIWSAFDKNGKTKSSGNEFLMLYKVTPVVFVVVWLVFLCFCIIDSPCFNKFHFMNSLQILINYAPIIIGASSLIVACLAYYHSKTSLEHSVFINLFNTQITLLRQLVSDDRLIETVHIDKNSSAVIDKKDYSVYKDFCLEFKKQASQAGSVPLSKEQISSIWSNFCNQILYRSEFTHSFKFIYLCVNTVDISPLSDKEKRHYIKVVSSLLTSEQLFCYFMSLVAFCSGDCSTDPTVRLLKKYQFFKRMMKGYLFREVAPFIPTDITKYFL